MPVVVELWLDEHLVYGAENWWDDIELAVGSQESAYPPLSAVDPYGQLVVQKHWLDDLAEECQRILPQARKRVQPFLQKLNAMCNRGFEANQAELRFIGD